MLFLNKHKARLFVYSIFVVLLLFWMRGWFTFELPANPREENINDLSYLWTLYRSYDQGVLFSVWNPLMLTGNTNVVQRGYFLLAPLAYIAYEGGIYPNTLYIIATFIFFLLSGIGFFEFLRRYKLSIIGSLVGALCYMFLPPHLTLGLDAIEFSAFWACIPCMLLVVQLYSERDHPIRHGILFGVLLSCALFVGTTYLFFALPFLAVYSILQINITKHTTLKSQLIFLVALGIYFLGLTAYATIPILFEYNSMWISIESTRKNIFSILSLTEVIDLFFLRIRGIDPMSWVYNRNHPDMAFYLGISVAVLSTAAFFQRSKRNILIPSLFLLFTFFAFVSLRFSIVHQLLKIILLMGISASLEQKILFILSVTFVSLAGIKVVGVGRIGIKKILLLVFSIPLIAILLLNIGRFQGIFDHTVRVFLFATISLSTLAAFGTDTILSYISKNKQWIMGGIILLIVVYDLFPFSAYFRRVSKNDIEESSEIYTLLTKDSLPGRYYTPFPYKDHLPVYRYEYQTRYINRYRLNNENIYTPFTPRFSTQLYDVALLGLLENKKIDPDFFLQLLDWGFTNHVILRKEIADYTGIILYMKKNNWTVEKEDNHLVYLKNTHPSDYIQIYSSFAPIDKANQSNPLFWHERSKQGIALYEGSDLSKSKQVIETNISTHAWTRPSADNITVIANLKESALVVTSEGWYPGWHVEIDDQEYPLVRANYAHLGVIAPQGKHKIIFTYKQPWYYSAGKLITLSTLGCLGIFFIWILKRRFRLQRLRL